MCYQDIILAFVSTTSHKHSYHCTTHDDVFCAKEILEVKLDSCYMQFINHTHKNSNMLKNLCINQVILMILSSLPQTRQKTTLSTIKKQFIVKNN